jgi:aquaglyceroporin related protein, other eukaryote
MAANQKATAGSKGKEFDTMAGGESSAESPLSGSGPTASHVEDAWRLHAEHGPPIDNEFAEAQYEEDYKHQSDLWWSRMRHHFRDPAAEFLGTFTMIVFGDGSVAQVVLSQNPKLPLSSQNKGDYQSISWG